MTVEQGKYGLWYSKGVGFATKDQAQAHEDGTDLQKLQPVLADTKTPPPIWPGIVVAAVMVIGVGVLVTKCARKTSAPDELGWNAALVMCQSALRSASRDPDKAEVPYVPNEGVGDEYSYTWGSGTSMTRMRNGLGLAMAAPASCTVSKSQRRIISLSLNGQVIL